MATKDKTRYRAQLLEAAKLAAAPEAHADGERMLRILKESCRARNVCITCQEVPPSIEPNQEEFPSVCAGCLRDLMTMLRHSLQITAREHRKELMRHVDAVDECALADRALTATETKRAADALRGVLRCWDLLNAMTREYDELADTVCRLQRGEPPALKEVPELGPLAAQVAGDVAELGELRATMIKRMRDNPAIVQWARPVAQA